jgi:hypothetical protein
MWTSLRVALFFSAASLSIGCDFFSLEDDDDQSGGGSANGATGGATSMGGTPALGGTGGSPALGGTGGTATGGAGQGGTGTDAGMGGSGGSLAGGPGGGTAGVAGASVAGAAGDMATGGVSAGGGAGMAGSASGAGGSGLMGCAALNPDAEAHGGHCYLLVDSPVTWTNAKSACMALGAHLVTISSESPLTQADFDSENDFVYNELGGSKDTWIGLSDGLMDKDSGTTDPFQWVNDEPLTLQNWNDSEPNHYMKDCMDGSDCWEHCVFMMTDPGGKWNDELCEITKQYVCEWDMGG